MAEIGTAYVDIKGDWDGFQKDAEGGFAKTAKIAGAVFAGAFVGKQIFDFGADAVDQASNLNESINAVQQTFDSVNADQLAVFGASAAENLGIAQSEFNGFAVQFGGFAKTINKENPGDEIEKIATRAADFASVMNMEVGDAAGKFQSIMAGSSEVARQYGIDVSSAAVEQYALESGLVAAGAEMTEAQKVQARYALLMRETEQWAGDFASTSDELANSQRIAKASFADVQAELGTALLPVLGEVMTMVRDSIAPLFKQLSPVFVLVAEAIAQIAPRVMELIEKLMPLVVKLLPPLMDILIVVIDLFLALLDPIIDLISKALDPLLPIIEMLVSDLGEALMPVILALAETFVALSPLLILMTDLLEPIIAVVGMLAKIVGAVLVVAVKFLTEAIGRLIENVRPAYEWLTNLWTVLSTKLAEILPDILDWFKELPGLIKDAVSGAIDWLMDTGKDLIQGLINGVKSMAGKVVKAIKDFVIDKIPGPIKSFFGIGSPSKLMMGFGSDISEGMAIGIRGNARSVSSAVGSLLNGPSGLLGGVTAANRANPLTQIFNAPVGGDMGLFADQVAAAQARELRYALG